MKPGQQAGLWTPCERQTEFRFPLISFIPIVLVLGSHHSERLKAAFSRNRWILRSENYMENQEQLVRTVITATKESESHAGMGGKCYGCYMLEVFGADRGILRTWGPSNYLFGSWRVLETFNFPGLNCVHFGGGGSGEDWEGGCFSPRGKSPGHCMPWASRCLSPGSILHRWVWFQCLKRSVVLQHGH